MNELQSADVYTVISKLNMLLGLKNHDAYKNQSEMSKWFDSFEANPALHTFTLTTLAVSGFLSGAVKLFILCQQ